jgi:hypothetical protein
MKPTDKVDDLLAEAGARWRADQPSAPEPDLDRILRGNRTARRWVPALAAASVAVIATAALVFLPDNDDAVPPPPVASSNKDDLVVRNGDKVEVDGEVYAAAGGTVGVFCAPFAQLRIGYPPGQEPTPRCPETHQIKLAGVDLERLSGPTTVKGVLVGRAHLVGTWNDNTITVQEQSAPRADPAALPDEVACPGPTGGWTPEDMSTKITPALQAYVGAHPDQLSLWLAWPEGYPTAAKIPPSVVMIGVKGTDVEAVRRVVAPMVSGNLCVSAAEFSPNDARALAAEVDKLPRAALGILGVSQGVGDKPVTVEMLVFDEKVEAALQQIGLDKLKLEPMVKPMR